MNLRSCFQHHCPGPIKLNDRGPARIISRAFSFPPWLGHSLFHHDSQQAEWNVRQAQQDGHANLPRTIKCTTYGTRSTNQDRRVILPHVCSSAPCAIVLICFRRRCPSNFGSCLQGVCSSSIGSCFPCKYEPKFDEHPLRKLYLYIYVDMYIYIYMYISLTSRRCSSNFGSCLQRAHVSDTGNKNQSLMNERVANMNHFLMNILSEKYNFRHICTHIYIYIYSVCSVLWCGAVCVLWGGVCSVAEGHWAEEGQEAGRRGDRRERRRTEGQGDRRSNFLRSRSKEFLWISQTSKECLLKFVGQRYRKPLSIKLLFMFAMLIVLMLPCYTSTWV
jgi:hypothetical protein